VQILPFERDFRSYRFEKLATWFIIWVISPNFFNKVAGLTVAEEKGRFVNLARVSTWVRANIWWVKRLE